MVTGPITTPDPQGRAYPFDWARIERWRPEATTAADEFGVPIERILAHVCIESGGDPRAVQRNRQSGDSLGLMQIVLFGVGWDGWWRRFKELSGSATGFDAYDPLLNLRVGASILRDFHKQHGSWDAASSCFFTGKPGWQGADSVNGNTGANYKRTLDGLIAELAPAGRPEPTPADPLERIVGGTLPAIDYGWLADAGLDYYDYGVNHGTSAATQHPGIDIPLPCGSPLYAPFSGVVDCVGSAGTPRWGQGCGYYQDVDGGGVGNVTILLDPGAVKLTLGHCRRAFVKPGDRVTAGQKVATVGSMNGCHVHVETSVQRNGSYWLVEPRAALSGITPAPAWSPIVYDIRNPADAARFELDAEEVKTLLGYCIPGRDGYRPQAIVYHIQDGHSAGSLDWWLHGYVNGVKVQASATVLIQRDGSILRVIPEEDGPWTNGKVDKPDAWGRALTNLAGGKPNRVVFTIEFEGEAGEGLTPAQEAAGIWQTERWMDGYGIPLANVGGHYQIDSVDRPGCPGDKVMALKAKLRGGTTSAPQPSQPSDPLVVAGFSLSMVRKLFADFDPDGPVSKQWLRHYEESGCLPRFVTTWAGGDGWKKAWEFSDGFFVFLTDQGAILGSDQL